MTRIKIMASITLAILFLFGQAGAAAAMPASQGATPITGTITSITVETDSGTGNTTVVVVLSDGATGATQTVRVGLEDALTLGLVTSDGLPDESLYGESFEIDSTLVIAEPEENQHPVGSALSDFFSDLLGVDYDTIMEYHDDGVGFGVIAQALWMTNALDGDTAIFAAILEARQSKDFSGITLPDGSTPQNWGQFRKAVMSDRDKAKENLGAIMSGRADDDQGQSGQNDHPNNGNGPDKDKDKNHGNPHDENVNPNNDSNNNGNSNPGNGNNNGNNGNNNGNGNGNNKDKNKDKGNKD